MTVKINMDMPKTCASCQLSKFVNMIDDSKKWFCIVEEKYSPILPTRRPSWCPLKEDK